MKLKSRVDITAKPENIYPMFLNAQMDERIPFVFRFGLPKAVSCSIIKGDGSAGSVRRCITTRGYMDQIIDVAQKPHHFVYHLVESDYWGQPHIGHVSDTISIETLPDGRSRVTRVTDFSARGWLKIFATPIMALGFYFAHSYANQNWRRIAESRE